LSVPKLTFELAPQASPPEADRFCAAGLDRLQSGRKLWFESVQLRLVLVAISDVGAAPVKMPAFWAGDR
jgi:hypothetical protein